MMMSLYARTKLIGVLILALCSFMPIEVGASHDAHAYHFFTVEVCNEGDTEISVAAALREGSFWGDPKWKYEGWYTVRPGRCKRVISDSSDLTPYLAFRQSDARGKPGIAPYRDGDGLSGYRYIKDASKHLCVPSSGAFKLEFEGKEMGSCYPGYVMAEFSAYLEVEFNESVDIRVDVASSATARVTPFDSGPAATEVPKKKSKPEPNLFIQMLKAYEEEQREERRAAYEEKLRAAREKKEQDALQQASVAPVTPPKSPDPSPRPGWLGITVQDVPSELAKSLKIRDVVSGVLVSEVIKDGPASKAFEMFVDRGKVGLFPGDVIVGLRHNEGEFADLHNVKQLTDILESVKSGDPIDLVILRQGKRLFMFLIASDSPTEKG